jgi:hypothetical protein
MMNVTDRKVILQLNEHDASQLLSLIRREINQSEKIWHPYWERLVQNVEQSIEHASFELFQRARQSIDSLDE